VAGVMVAVACIFASPTYVGFRCISTDKVPETRHNDIYLFIKIIVVTYLLMSVRQLILFYTVMIYQRGSSRGSSA
jgi:hypothetical protein